MLQMRLAEESSRYDADHEEHEVSRFNPDAVRGPNGIWNEETLPVLDWEDAAHRIVLSADLQRNLGLVQPVLRWQRDKRLRAFQKHLRIAHLGFSDAGFWAEWERFGTEPPKRISWNVFFTHQGAVSIAVLSRHHGELTFTTVFSPRTSWLEERLRAGEGHWTFRRGGERK